MSLIKRKPSARYKTAAKNAPARLGDTDAIIDILTGVDATGNITVPSGTAASPGLKGGYTNSGIYFGSGYVGISTAASERVVIDGQGDINVYGGAGIEGGNPGTTKVWAGFYPVKGQQTIANANTAIAVDTYLTTISNSGNTTHTLANGVVIGQVKKIVGVGTLTGTAVITPANLANGTAITLSVIGDTVELIFDGTKWYVVAAYNEKGGVITSPVVA